MTFRIALAAVILAASAGLAAAATRYGENDLRVAMIQMEDNKPEAGQTVDAFISCLRYWNPGDRHQPNEVQIERLKDDTFTVSAVLKSRAFFHFQVTKEHGYLVALLRRVEYSVVPQGGAYQQLTDAESTRVVVRSTCEKP